MSKHWTELVEEKRTRQKASIPKEWLITIPPDKVIDVTAIPENCGLLSAKEIEITRTDVEGLLEKLAKAEWSALEVVTAFSKRAIIAHQLVNLIHNFHIPSFTCRVQTNCLTEVFIDRAIARAKVLDEHLKTTGKVVGPFHGLPISLKDQIRIKGLEATMGYVSWIGEYATRNAVLVDILEDAGAVLFVKTNVPQTLMVRYRT
jgi:amidase